jgi:hypothetical protein
MLQQVTIRSRSGNKALALAGLTYLLCALATLFVFVKTTWFGASLVDRALQLALLGAAFGGAFFLHIATRNLGGPPWLTLRRH